jgi:hypothetical protein
VPVGKQTDHQPVDLVFLAHDYFGYFGINLPYLFLMRFVLFNGYGFHTQYLILNLSKIA